MDGPHIRVNKELVELNVYSNQEKNISINSEVKPARRDDDTKRYS